MNYQDIPKYDSWRAWKTAEGKWEVKLECKLGGIELHLSEDESAKDDCIEDGKFYLHTEHMPTGLKWIRERKAFEMNYDDGLSPTVDADYVTLNQDGKQYEHQHNHVHLDRDVKNDNLVALTPA